MVKGIVRAAVIGAALCNTPLADSAQGSLPSPLGIAIEEISMFDTPNTDPVLDCQLKWINYWEKLSRGLPVLPPDCIP